MKNRSTFEIIVKLFDLVKPLMHIMLFTITTGILGFLCAIFIPIIGGIAISTLAGEYNYNLQTLFTIAISIGVLRGILRYAEQVSGHYIAFKLLAIIRDKVYLALRRLSPAKLENKEKGNLISIITGDIELLEVFYAHTIAPVCIAFVVSVFMIVYISKFSISQAVILTMGYIYVGILVPFINSKMSSEKGRFVREKSGKLSSFTLDILRGLKEIIQYNQVNKASEKLDIFTDDLEGRQKSLRNNDAIARVLTDFGVILTSFAVLLNGVYIYLNGSDNYFGIIIIPTLAAISSFGPVIALTSLSNTLTQTFACANRVLNILEEEPMIEDVTEGVETTADNITVKDVNFTYPTPHSTKKAEIEANKTYSCDIILENSDTKLNSSDGILENANFEFKSDEITGIMGPSGCGKSTLLKLIMRFWKLDSGEITIGSENIDNIITKSLRKNISYVTQDTDMFNLSIADNIKIGKHDATMDEVIVAAKKASIHDFIDSLPNAYNTNVGELGDLISGGERQRIGLARAFLHGGEIILLDEPTSNLDSLNEGIILKALQENIAGKTVIIVSHRLSSLGIADRIITMN